MGKETVKYEESFKKSLVTLHQNGKSQTQLCKEYGVSQSALGKWIKLYSEVKLDDDTIVTGQQIKELQKRNAILEEENLILKKAIDAVRMLRILRIRTRCALCAAIFTPHSPSV